MSAGLSAQGTRLEDAENIGLHSLRDVIRYFAARIYQSRPFCHGRISLGIHAVTWYFRIVYYVSDDDNNNNTKSTNTAAVVVVVVVVVVDVQKKKKIILYIVIIIIQ